MPDQNEKDEIARKIREQIQRNIAAGISGKQSLGSASSSNSLEVGGASSGGASGGSKGIYNRITENKRIQNLKDRVGDSVMAKEVAGKIEAARASKEIYKQQAESKIRDVSGGAGRRVAKFNAEANRLKAKIAAKKKAIKNALKVQAKKSRFSGKTVALITIVTFVLATLVDIIDVIGALGFELGFVPTIIAYAINFLSSSFVFMAWLLVFGGSNGKGTRQTRMIIRTLFMLFGLENIPIIELLPFNSISVVLNYLDFRAGQKEANQ